MKWMLIAMGMMMSQLAGAETKLKTVTVNEVYEDNGYLVVETDKGVRRIKMNDALKNSLNFEIKVHDRELIEGEGKVIRRALTLEERTALRKTIVEARSFYKSKRYTQAWDKVNEGQKIDPWNITLLNMKGSILYVTGSQELALSHWHKSLEVKPKQPKLTNLVEKVEAKLAKKTDGGSTPAQSKEVGKSGDAKDMSKSLDKNQRKRS